MPRTIHDSKSDMSLVHGYNMIVRVHAPPDFAGNTHIEDGKELMIDAVEKAGPAKLKEFVQRYQLDDGTLIQATLRYGEQLIDIFPGDLEGRQRSSALFSFTPSFSPARPRAVIIANPSDPEGITVKIEEDHAEGGRYYCQDNKGDDLLLSIGEYHPDSWWPEGAEFNYAVAGQFVYGYGYPFFETYDLGVIVGAAIIEKKTLLVVTSKTASSVTTLYFYSYPLHSIDFENREEITTDDCVLVHTANPITNDERGNVTVCTFNDEGTKAVISSLDVEKIAAGESYYHNEQTVNDIEIEHLNGNELNITVTPTYTEHRVSETENSYPYSTSSETFSDNPSVGPVFKADFTDEFYNSFGEAETGLFDYFASWTSPACVGPDGPFGTSIFYDCKTGSVVYSGPNGWKCTNDAGDVKYVKKHRCINWDRTSSAYAIGDSVRNRAENYDAPPAHAVIMKGDGEKVTAYMHNKYHDYETGLPGDGVFIEGQGVIAGYNIDAINGSGTSAHIATEIAEVDGLNAVSGARIYYVTPGGGHGFGGVRPKTCRYTKDYIWQLGTKFHWQEDDDAVFQNAVQTTNGGKNDHYWDTGTYNVGAPLVEKTTLEGRSNAYKITPSDAGSNYPRHSTSPHGVSEYTYTNSDPMLFSLRHNIGVYYTYKTPTTGGTLAFYPANPDVISYGDEDEIVDDYEAYFTFDHDGERSDVPGLPAYHIGDAFNEKPRGRTSYSGLDKQPLKAEETLPESSYSIRSSSISFPFQSCDNPLGYMLFSGGDQALQRDGGDYDRDTSAITFMMYVYNMEDKTFVNIIEKYNEALEKHNLDTGNSYLPLEYEVVDPTFDDYLPECGVINRYLTD